MKTNVALIEAVGAAGLGAVPQLYRTAAADAAARHPVFARAFAACRERWGTDELVVESQTVDLRARMHPGIPRWQPVPPTSRGEVAIACLSPAPLLEIDGLPVDAHALHFVAVGSRWRFLAAVGPQPAVVVLVRPADGMRPAGVARHSARIFAPSPPIAERPLPAWALVRDLTFRSSIQETGALPAIDRRTVADEPLLAAASVPELRASGGPVAQAFVEALPAPWRTDPDVIVQVKRDELSRGWYPALIGWHMDGTSRIAKRDDGTPDLRAPGRTVEQILVCLGDTAPTAFLRGELRLPEIPVGTPAEESAGVWQRLVCDDIDDGRVVVELAPADRLVQFGFGGFHTASRAARDGWRLFLKAMRGRGDTPRNERSLRGTVSWPCDAKTMPDDPCGVFPEV